MLIRYEKLIRYDMLLTKKTKKTKKSSISPAYYKQYLQFD